MTATYITANVVFGILIGGVAVVFAWGVRKDKDLWRKLPRAAVLGMALGIPCLIGAAWHGTNLLQGDLAGLRIYVWLLMPVIAVLSWFYLDFLFTRALGGIFLLSVPHLLHLAFSLEIAGRPLYSALCYIFGVGGMLLVAMPWRFRDLLHKATNHALLQRSVAIFLSLSALYFICAVFFGLT